MADTRHLHLAPDGAAAPDDRAEVARALLDRMCPVEPVVEDAMLAFSGGDHRKLDEVERDPRYLIGRLTQMLSGLLAGEVPSMDATAELLADAIDTAADALQASAAECRCDGDCGQCRPLFVQAEQFRSLFGQLGLIGDLPKSPPDLRAV